MLSRTTKVENAEDGGERDIGVHVDRNPGNKYSCVKKKLVWIKVSNIKLQMIYC